MSAGNDAVQMSTDHGVINYGTVLTYSEVRQIALDVSKSVLLESRQHAELTITERAESITDRVIVKIQERDEALFQRFKDPRFLAALTSVQRSYAETGDVELGEVLASLLADMASKEIRSRREIVLRQAVECAPRLTTKHLNALSVIFRIDKVRYPFARTPSALAAVLALDLAPYFNGVPDDSFDYEYMGSTEAGTYLPMTSSKYLNRVYYAHHNALYEPFAINDFAQAFNTKTTSADEIQARMSQVMSFLKTVPDDPQKRIKLDFEVGQRLLSNEDHIVKSLKPGENNLRAFLKNRSISSEEFSTLIREQQPELSAFFDKLQRSRAFDFRLSPVGLMLARHEIVSRSPETAPLIDPLFED